MSRRRLGELREVERFDLELKEIWFQDQRQAKEGVGGKEGEANELELKTTDPIRRSVQRSAVLLG